jgi:ribosomal-protein-serine acetyltransferase
VAPRRCQTIPVARLPDVLSNDELELRSISLTDFDAAFGAVKESLPEVRRWLWWAQVPLDEGSYGEFVRHQSHNFADDVEWRYFIFDRSSGHLVGGCSVELITSGESPRTNLGYWVRTTRTGRGIATQTAKILTECVFEHLPEITLVEIGMDVANVASARVPEKLGFSLVGEFDKSLRAPGHTGRGLNWVMRRVDWERG